MLIGIANGFPHADLTGNDNFRLDIGFVYAGAISRRPQRDLQALFCGDSFGALS